jgi:hypothetical protein
MKKSEELLRYVQRARAAGVEVDFVATEDFPGRLAAFLSENRGLTRSFAGQPELHPTEISTPLAPLAGRTALVAALPASDWPQPIRDMVESALGASGFQIVTPRQTVDGYSWEREQIARAALGLTFCSVFLADTGSMVLPAGPGAGTLAALLPEVHLALSYPEGCRGSLAAYLPEVSPALPSRLTLVTGPSRTGDIEATMTTGVHGPRKVFHYILLKPKS